MKSSREWTNQEKRWYEEVILDVSYDSLQEGYPHGSFKKPDLKYMYEHETNSFKKDVIKNIMKSDCNWDWSGN